MLPLRPPLMGGAPVAPGSAPPHGMMVPPGMAPSMMAMRGLPPRGPPPMMFAPGRGPAPTMMAPMNGGGGMPPPPGMVGATPPRIALPETGPLNVFVGKLPTDLNDAYVRKLLEKCGMVLSWKRTLDPVTSKPKAFGYCMYAGAMDVLRALRLLNGFSVDSKQILVKVDTKTQAKLDEYAAAMTERMKQDEQARDAELRRVLKSVEDERSGLMGGIQNHPESWGDLLGKKARSGGTDDRDGAAAREGEAGADGESGESAPVDTKVQQKMILSEIEKFRLAQDQREQEQEQKRRDAVRDRLRQEQKEEERRKASEAAGAAATAPSEVALPVEEKPTALEIKERATDPPVELGEKPDGEVEINSREEKDKEIEDGVKQRESSKTRERGRDRDPDRYRDHDRGRDRERKDRDRDRGRRKRMRSHSRSRSRERASRRRRRSRSHSRSRSRSHDRDRDRDRHRDRDRRRQRRRRSSAAEEELGPDHRSKRRRHSRSDDLETSNQPAPEAPAKAPVKVVMDLKMSIGAPKKEKSLPAPATSLFKVEDEVELKPVREFVRIDFAEEERVAAAKAQQQAAATAAKINGRAEDVKALIDSIPTDKAALFAYLVDWAAVEKHRIVKDKMAPWVTKKVLEYVGEEDATMISFILKKLASKAAPNEILEELLLVLEDEAEVFVKLLWRKLAFETLRAAA